ncbi:anthranilate synthase component II [Desulfocarbo indianensis]|nr:anthranilate synthase component II [Desulfocarbo indianensis]
MILVVDNYDSFTYNIVQCLGSLGEDVQVARNDAITLAQAKALEPQAIVISPGPGRPEESGITLKVIEHFFERVPILGVCLGHQAIGMVLGAELVRAAKPMHGKLSQVYHDGKGVLTGLRNPFLAVRYHSLILPEETIKPPLKVSAYTLEGEVMGLRVEGLPVEGVQFHPESIGTAQGMHIIENFLSHHVRPGAAHAAQLKTSEPRRDAAGLM